MITEYISSLSSIFKSLHTERSISRETLKRLIGEKDLESCLSILNILFQSSFRLTENTLEISPEMRDKIIACQTDDFVYLQFLETHLKAEKTKAHQLLLLESLQLIYERLFQLNQDVSPLLPTLFNAGKNDLSILAGINEAIHNTITLGLNYFSLASRETTLRKIDPYFFKAHHNQLYLVGFCHKHQEVRTFLISRIKGITKTYSVFEKDPRMTDEQLFKYSLGIYLGDKDAQWITIKCKNYLLPILKAHPIHKTQQISYDSVDYFTVKCQMHVTDELRRKLLSYGSEIEILYPSSLINDLVDEAEQLKKMYR